jgi:hypothetical protein
MAGNISLSLDEVATTIVPLGVHGFNDKTTNAFFVFNYTLPQAAIEHLLFEILDANGIILYHSILPSNDNTFGVNKIFWDGFDDQGIYDSSRFNKQQLSARLTVAYGGASTSVELLCYAKYQKVPWLDLCINRHTKVITGTLRTNFQQGSDFNADKKAVIPESTLKTIGKVPLEKPSKDFDGLLQLASEGLFYHWGRNNQHPQGKNLKIQDHGEYQFFLKVENTTSNAIKSPKIIFQSNARSMRSRNWELSRLLFYQVAYLKSSGKWYYRAESKADEEFKYIAAHEIGHEILLAYGGHMYSKTHKGSSTLITQHPLGNCLYPQSGEIDLMLYYAEDKQHPFPERFYARSIAAEDDVRSLLWLNKVEIRAIKR